jgi:hypothetical protein
MMKKSKAQFFCSKFRRARERVSRKFIDNWASTLYVSPALDCCAIVYTSGHRIVFCVSVTG